MSHTLYHILLNFLRTRNESLRGPLLVLINQEIDTVKSKDQHYAELFLKAIRTTMSKRKVHFDVLRWLLSEVYALVKQSVHTTKDSELCSEDLLPTEVKNAS